MRFPRKNTASPPDIPVFAARQLLGARERQEDQFDVTELKDGGDGKGPLLMLVADGMGGHAGGAEAAQSAVARFAKSMAAADGDVPAQLHTALAAANNSIEELVTQSPELEGAGCTLRAAIVEHGRLWWISVGDSALYLLRNGTLTRLNDDHSMRPVFEEMVRAGRMRTTQAATHPHRNALRSALTGEELKLVDQSGEPLSLSVGDQVILASDGLDTLKPREIAQLLVRHARRTPESAVEALAAKIESIASPAQDNTTMILYRMPTDAPSAGRRRKWFF